MVPRIRATLAASVFGASLLALSAPAVEAATFKLSYAASEGLLLGTLTGTLAPDGNTVVVSAITQVSFRGMAMRPMTYLQSLYAFGDPIVTRDGSDMSLYAEGLPADFLYLFNDRFGNAVEVLKDTLDVV